VKSARSLLLRKDFSSLLGEDDDAKASHAAFAQRVAARMGDPGIWYSCYNPDAAHNQPDGGARDYGSAGLQRLWICRIVWTTVIQADLWRHRRHYCHTDQCPQCCPGTHDAARLFGQTPSNSARCAHASKAGGHLRQECLDHAPRQGAERSIYQQRFWGRGLEISEHAQRGGGNDKAEQGYYAAKEWQGVGARSFTLRPTIKQRVRMPLSRAATLAAASTLTTICKVHYNSL
jgi:hypothetical protein